MPVMPPEYYKENEDRAQETLDRLLDPAWGKPRSVVTAVRWGSPVEAIVSYAVDHRIDLIVIATHGRTGLEPRPAGLGRRADRPRGPLPRPHDPRPHAARPSCTAIRRLGRR